jgi:hypothetical protein
MRRKTSMAPPEFNAAGRANSLSRIVLHNTEGWVRKVRPGVILSVREGSAVRKRGEKADSSSTPKAWRTQNDRCGSRVPPYTSSFPGLSIPVGSTWSFTALSIAVLIGPFSEPIHGIWSVPTP